MTTANNVNYVVNYIPKSTPYSRRSGTLISPTTITIHNTGNPSSSAANERAWLTNPTNARQASWHIVIDEHGAIEAVPLNERALHAGTSTGNNTSIGVEICESGNYVKTLDNATTLVAKLLKERGWGVDKLRRHYDWSGKICPRLMYDGGKWTGWATFKAAVQAKLNEEELTMKVADANAIITKYLQPAYFAAKTKDERDEAHRLAEALRLASGQKK